MRTPAKAGAQSATTQHRLSTALDPGLRRGSRDEL